MQGGGSLGAYACGVFKVLAKHKIKFDIISGVFIGAVNRAIIAAGLRRAGDCKAWNNKKCRKMLQKR
jgi:predicted acylesterase/phospholipase RssA